VHCPDASGKEGNCSISFFDNWLYKTTVVQKEQCSGAGANVFGNVNISSGKLPADAQAVVDDAGPRV
jgi:hypothetical protein